MLASKQRAGTTFWRAASCKNLALLNKFSEELRRQESLEESLNVQCGLRQGPYYVSAALSLGQSGLRLCT